MKLSRRKFLQWSALSLLTTACATQPEEAPSQAAPTATVPPTVPPTPTPLPSPELTARTFLGGWERGQYEAMYGMLSDDAKASTSQEAFVKRYRDIASEGAFTAVKTQVKDVDQALNHANV